MENDGLEDRPPPEKRCYHPRIHVNGHEFKRIDYHEELIIMPMKNPPHPGRSIKDAGLDPLGLSITAGAKILGVTRPVLSKVINGKAAISPDMAVRLAKAFGGRAETWLKMQLAYDLAQVERKADSIRVRRVQPQI